MKRILVSDKLSPKGVEVLKKGGFHVDVKTGLSNEEQKSIIKEYDGLVIRSATKVTQEIIDAASLRARFFACVSACFIVISCSSNSARLKRYR